MDGTTNVAIGRTISNPTNLNYLRSMVTDIVYLAANSYIELCAYHSSGASTEDIQSGTMDTYLAMHLLSRA